MNKKIVLDKLLKYFIKDSSKIPKDLAGKIKLWKEIVNTYDLSNVPIDIIIAEDKFLAYEKIDRPLMDADNLYNIGEELVKNIKYSNYISVWSGDPITLYVDGIVHLTSTKYLVEYQVKVDKVIYNSGMRLKKKCRSILNDMDLKPMEVLITRGFNLPADYILHVKEPDGRRKNYDEDIKQFYFNILECVRNNLIRSIVIPCIGIKKDKNKYIDLMLNSIYEFLDLHHENLETLIIINVCENDGKIVKEKLLERVEK